jgi:hypothetical protein
MDTITNSAQYQPVAEPEYELPVLGYCQTPHWDDVLGDFRTVPAFHERMGLTLCDECCYGVDVRTHWLA